ncbi:MAG: GFA family protein [Rhodospirillaceae bacterium]|jgi:hypothetical protein|nr:GFA family protein [Rhodospirillaceae bacterium]MBT5458604.1 GFA family protein [Rhodospirillaceae bacterium]
MTSYATGGCLCGDVRYECIEAPLMMGSCHCRDCQLHSGSAFATLMIFKKENVSFTGDSLARFTHKGGSGQSVERGFCKNCGSSISAFYDVTPDFMVVMAGTLDDPALVQPKWNIYTAGKQPWVELSPHMQSFEGGYGRG